ncbi:MAG: hypothetical protein KKH92_09740 [Firmicutes bacterium]|nr:hypothetical protein [Bacillota bacterium]
METSKNILIKYNGAVVCTIDNSNPSFQELVSFVNSNKTIDIDLFSIDKIEKFDTDGFINIIKSSVKQYLEKKEINLKLYDKLKKKLEEKED